MRKNLMLFLFLIMPLQLTWAAVASYCQHEQGAAAAHWSHHPHQNPHQNPFGNQSEPATQAAKAGSKISLDLDCATCHASAWVAVVQAAPSLARVAVSSPWHSAPEAWALLPRPAHIDRPKWPPHA